MTTLDWAERKTVSPSFRDIKQRGLTGNLEELEAYGLTVITPDQLGEPPVLKRARDAILALAEERTGVRHDIETGAHGTLDSTGSNPNQYLLYAFLERDPVFEEIVRHPATLPLVEYYLGADCQLSSLTSFIKWQNESGDGPKGLHSDSALYRNGPLPDRPHVFNTTGSSPTTPRTTGRLRSFPGRTACNVIRSLVRAWDEVVPVEAPAGSVLVFHGNVWHSAFPRRNPGLRVSINACYCGPHYRAQESFRGRISDEILARNDDRFAQLLGYDDPWGFTDSRGPVPYSLR